MSVKIYTGFKFKTNDIFALQKILAPFRQKVTHSAYLSVCAKIARLKQEIIDIKHFDPSYTNEDDSYWKVMDEFQKKKNENYGFEIIIYPFKKTLFGTYHTGLYTEKSLDDQFFLDCQAEKYYYFNNTDRPEEITARNWRKREKTWNEIFKGTGVPSDTGMSIQFLDCYYKLPRKEDIEATEISLPYRIERVANHLATKEPWQDELKEGIKKTPIHETIEVFRKHTNAKKELIKDDPYWKANVTEENQHTGS